MKRNTIFIRILFIAVACNAAALWGCAGMRAWNPNIETQIDTLTEKRQYDKALEIIAAVPESHNNYETLQKRAAAIEASREKEVRTAISKARAAESMQNWSAAAAWAADALSLMPGDPELIVMRQAYEKKRTESIRQSRRNLLTAKGRYLADIRASQENLVLADPDSPSAHRRYRKYMESVLSVSEELYAHGRNAFYEKEIHEAREALSLSARLHPCEKTRSLLAETHRIKQQDALAKAAADLPEAHRVTPEDRFPELAKRFGQAMAAGNLADARRLAREMEEIDPERSKDYENRIAGPIEEKAASLRARGRLLYGQGFIKEALEVWQEALQLKPESPELIQNIHRARTFLENLNRWREDGSEKTDYGS